MNLAEQMAIQAMYDAQIKAEKADNDEATVPAPAPKRRGRPRKAAD